MSPAAERCASSKSELFGVSASFAANGSLQPAKKDRARGDKTCALQSCSLSNNYNSRCLVCDERERRGKLRRSAIYATTFVI
jgi:hypothetical protein